MADLRIFVGGFYELNSPMSGSRYKTTLYAAFPVNLSSSSAITWERNSSYNVIRKYSSGVETEGLLRCN